MTATDTPGFRQQLARMTDDDLTRRIAELKSVEDRLTKIRDGVLIEKVDYGQLRKGGKAVLFKPGAEKLLSLFGFVARFELTATYGDGVTAPAARVAVHCWIHQGDDHGPVVAEGVGEANTWEPEWRYTVQRRRCPVCNRPGLAYSRREDNPEWYCWTKAGGCGARFDQDDPRVVDQPDRQWVENPDQAGLANTLRKMAKKRALVDGTLTACCASGLFTQDIEDDETTQAAADTATPAADTATPPAAPPVPNITVRANGALRHIALLSDDRRAYARDTICAGVTKFTPEAVAAVPGLTETLEVWIEGGCLLPTEIADRVRDEISTALDEAIDQAITRVDPATLPRGLDNVVTTAEQLAAAIAAKTTDPAPKSRRARKPAPAPEPEAKPKRPRKPAPTTCEHGVTPANCCDSCFPYTEPDGTKTPF